MQQAQILRSFISRSQPVSASLGHEAQQTSSLNGIPTTQPASNNSATKITISDGEAEASSSDSEDGSGSDYETSSISDRSEESYSSEENDTRMVELEENVELKVESELINSETAYGGTAPSDIKMVELGPINGIEPIATVANESSDEEYEDETESAESPEPEEIIDYRQKKVDELRSLAIEKGIVTTIEDAKKIKKTELITLLSAGATVTLE